MALRVDEARARSVRQWRRILAGIGRRDARAIVCDLNEPSAMCELALEDAGGEARRCRYCTVFDNAGRCAEARWRITGALLSGEIETARTATAAVIERIIAAGPAELH